MNCRCGCGQLVFYPRSGLAKSCYDRWLYHGRPEPPPPPGRPSAYGPRLGRLEDYAELRSWGESIASAAARLGVSERSGWRYESELRRQHAAAA